MPDAGCRMQEAFGVGREFLFLVDPTEPEGFGGRDFSHFARGFNH